MAEANPKTSAVIVTSPHSLTADQVACIKAAVELGVPPDVGVVVLGGLKVDVVGATPVAMDMVPGELADDDTQAQILAELKALRVVLAEREQQHNHDSSSLILRKEPLLPLAVIPLGSSNVL